MSREIEDGMGFAGFDPRLTPEEKHIERLQRENKKLVVVNAELRELLRQIHEAANKVYQMGDATCRNVLVNIYEISGKVAALSSEGRKP